MITDYKLVNTERKTGGNFTFFRNILLFGDNKEYQVIKDQQKGLELAKFLTQKFCINPTEEEEDDYETC